jgi:hypothetical protein
MPTHLKKLVRSRMEKTGESYATALRYVRLRGARRRDVRREAEPRPTQAAVSAPSRRYRYRGTLRHDPAIDAYIRSVKGEIGAVVARLVALVRSSVPGRDELRVHGAPQFCIEGEPFCYVVGYAKHVNLGFCDGASLPDPDGLLEGTGKAMRHVKIRPGATFPGGTLSRMVQEAARRVRARQSDGPAPSKEVRDARR